MTRTKLALNQRMTPHNDFFADVSQAQALGYDGIGLDEIKMPEGIDARALEAMEAAGLVSTFVTPSIWPIIPGPLDQPGQLTDISARVEAICASVERLAKFSPLGVVVGGGRSGDPTNPAGTPDEIAEPLARIAKTAAAYGMDVALEVMPLRRGSAIPDVPTAVALLDELGLSNIGLLIDVQHVWDEADRDPVLTKNASRVLYAQLNDVRSPQRTWADRLLPGDGLSQAPAIANALQAGGYQGWWELEVFSDDGTFGVELEDSLWRMPHLELLRLGKERMLRTLGSLSGEA
ncbi:sugar phosphate isomerase/epimerase family protein [Dactylosporangium sp. NPDC051484]|uniref:sugar phosphate isomerase/epimerase family protein n=1 Tax=Dactylosporangium sp. NPDC051484 TaxID=3154942 RepID=UPI00344CD87A